MAACLLQVAGAFVEAIADGHTNIVNQVRATHLSRASNPRHLQTIAHVLPAASQFMACTAVTGRKAVSTSGRLPLQLSSARCSSKHPLCAQNCLCCRSSTLWLLHLVAFP